MKKIIFLSLCSFIILASCKKEKQEVVQQNISLTDFTNWKYEADLVSTSKTILLDGDYEKMKTAIDKVEVQLKIDGKLQTLPYISIVNDLAKSYFYTLNGKEVTLYRQFNKVVLAPVGSNPKPEEVQLTFHSIK